MSSRFGVATALADDDVVGLGVEADDGDVEVLLIEEKPDLGSLGRRFALVRLLLDECAERLRACPHAVVDAAVDYGSFALGGAASRQDRQLGLLRDEHIRYREEGTQQQHGMGSRWFHLCHLAEWSVAIDSAVCSA